MSGEDAHLPTRDEIIDRALGELDAARNAAEEALSWMRSDWRPMDSSWTSEQYEAVSAMRDAAAEIKASVDRAKGKANR